MKHASTHSTLAMWRAWAKSLDLRAADMAACLSIIGACIVVGLLTVKIPVHRAYHRARIKTATVRLGSKHAGALLSLTLADGRTAVLSTNLVHEKLSPGAEICLQELTDAWRGGAWFQHAPADRCLTQAPAG